MHWPKSFPEEHVRSSKIDFFVLLQVTLMKLEELDDALGVFSSLGDILLFAFDEMIWWTSCVTTHMIYLI